VGDTDGEVSLWVILMGRCLCGAEKNSEVGTTRSVGDPTE